MRYMAVDASGKNLELKNPVCITLSMEEEIPADNFCGLFSVDSKTADFCYILIYSKNKPVFKGIVDEQTETISQKGRLLEISARSMAAVLLDNEAMPKNYLSPDMGVLMDFNFSPLGFEEYIGEDKQKSGRIVISKGTSEWDVLRRYAENFLGVVPRVNSESIIDVSGNSCEDMLYISNSGENKFLSLKHSRKRYKLISEIYIRTDRFGGYGMCVKNDKAIALGVQRRRCVNTADSRNISAGACEKTIERTNKEYETVSLVLSGAILPRLGTKAVIEGFEEKNLYIRAVKYQMDSTGEKTALKLFAE